MDNVNNIFKDSHCQRGFFGIYNQPAIGQKTLTVRPVDKNIFLPISS